MDGVVDVFMQHKCNIQLKVMLQEIWDMKE